MLKFKTVNTVFLIFLLLLPVCAFFQNWEIRSLMYPAAGLLGIWLVFTAAGSFWIQLNYHFHSFNHHYPISRREVSITFDDGPHPEITPKILEILEKHQARATFFVIGKRAEENPDLVLQILKKGHSIGNHSYSHSRLTGFFSPGKMKREIEKADSVLQKITGKKMKMYRPPFGVTNPNIKKALLQTSHNPIGWSRRSLDTTPLSAEKIFRRITKNLRKGDIILLHDQNLKALAVLERLLLFLKTQNLQPVSVDRLLEIEAYA